MTATPQQDLNVSQAPGEGRDFPSAIDFALRQHTLWNNSMLPAEVISFDRIKNVVVCRPIIMLVDTTGKLQSRKALANVPCLSLGGGGFHISFPLQVGDLGWILASDRDTALFLQTLKESPPPTGASQTFEHGLFIPDVFRKYAIAAEDSAAMVIQSTDGSTKISIRNGDILIAAPNKLVIRTPQTEIDGDLTVTGLTQANGGFDASSASGNAPCVLPQSTTINNILVAGHGHEQQGTSGRTAGGMEQ